MQKLEELGKWVKARPGRQAQLAADLGIPNQQGKISKWINGSEGITPAFREKLSSLGYVGPWPEEVRTTSLDLAEPTPPHGAMGDLSDHVAGSWRILHEAARAGGADLMAMDVDAVAEILGSIAEAVAMGRGEEARLRLVRRAEVLLRAVGRAAP